MTGPEQRISPSCLRVVDKKKKKRVNMINIMIDGLTRLNVESLRVGLWVVSFNDSRSTSRIWDIPLGARWNPEFILLDALCL